MKRALQTTLIDMVSELETHALQYALVGGLATSLRGRVRVTNDIDLVLKCDVEQALAFVSKLDPTCFSPLVPDIAALARSAFLIPLVHQKTQVQLDLSIGMSGFEQQLLARATQLSVAGRELVVATAEDLLLMKALAGRPQDNQDIEGIVSVRGPSTSAVWR